MRSRWCVGGRLWSLRRLHHLFGSRNAPHRFRGGRVIQFLDSAAGFVLAVANIWRSHCRARLLRRADIAPASPYSIGAEDADALGAKSRADIYYPVIVRAIAQLPSNTNEARQILYDRARAALVAQLDELSAQKSKSEVADERLALEMAIRRAEEGALPSQFPRAAPEMVSVGEDSRKQFRQSVPIGSPLHRPTTTLLVISIFFPRIWLIDVTCMSLYWVARLPKL
jgi:hypothetical protein